MRKAQAILTDQELTIMKLVWRLGTPTFVNVAHRNLLQDNLSECSAATPGHSNAAAAREYRGRRVPQVDRGNGAHNLISWCSTPIRTT